MGVGSGWEVSAGRVGAGCAAPGPQSPKTCARSQARPRPTTTPKPETPLHSFSTPQDSLLGTVGGTALSERQLCFCRMHSEN